MKCYLYYTGSPYTHPAPFRSITEAKEDFLASARELDRLGQRCEATIHIAPTREQMDEYPDYVLSLTARGNLRCERA